MAKNIISVIEFTDGYVRFVQAKPGGAKPNIVYCDRKPLDFHSDEESIRVLAELTRSKSIEPEKTFLVIPRRFVIIKQLRLPSQNSQELRKMISLQLVNQIPYSVDEVIYDYQLFSKDKEGYSRVLAVIVNKDVTSRYLKILKSAGIKSARMTMSSFGVLHWYANISQSKPGNAEAEMLVNMDAMHSEICFVQDGNLLFSRSVNYGERDLNGEGLHGLINEIKSTQAAYHHEKMGPDVKRTHIISLMKEAELLQAEIGQSLNLYADITSPFEGVSIKDGIKKHAQKNTGWSVAVCAGVCISKPKDFINLTPQEIHEDKQQSVRKRLWVMFGLLFVLSLVSAGIYFSIDNHRLKKELALLEKRNESYAPHIKKAQQQQAFIEALKAELQGRVSVTGIIDELYKLTPEDISFRSLLLDERGSLTIQGYSQTSSAVNNFQQKLVGSDIFSEVNLQFATKRRIFNMDVTDFKIVTSLEGMRP